MGAVANLLAMDRTTLTAALKPLERQGFVANGIDPDDRRSRLLILTDGGREALASALPTWRDTHAAVEAQLEELDACRLRSALSALT